MKKLAATMLACLLPLAGAAAAEKENSEPLRRLRLGVAVGTEETIRDRLEPFRKELEAALDLPVDLFLLDTLGNVVDALAAGDIDYARLSASAYAATYSLCECVEPLATARPDAFPARYYALIVSRTTERPLTLADLADGRLGVQDPESVTGYRVPLTNLAAEGSDPRVFFRGLVRMRDPVDGLQAILDGRVDAATAWSTLAGSAASGYTAGTLNEFYLSGAPGLERLKVIWQSPPIPYDAHTVRLSLPDEFKRKLRGALLDMKDQAPDAYFAVEPDLPGGFEPTVHADYRAVLRTYNPKYQAVLDGGGTQTRPSAEGPGKPSLANPSR